MYYVLNPRTKMADIGSHVRPDISWAIIFAPAFKDEKPHRKPKHLAVLFHDFFFSSRVLYAKGGSFNTVPLIWLSAAKKTDTLQQL